MIERTVFLARHGSREDSENPEWAHFAENPYDPGLSDTGVREARRLGQDWHESGSLTFIVQTDDGVVIVGHGATIEGVVARLLEGRPFDPSADPASLFRLDLQQGSWTLVFRNDISFIS